MLVILLRLGLRLLKVGKNGFNFMKVLLLLNVMVVLVKLLLYGKFFKVLVWKGFFCFIFFGLLVLKCCVVVRFVGLNFIIFGIGLVKLFVLSSGLIGFCS